MTRLAIDPGNDTGWALLGAGGKLVSCGLGDPRWDSPCVTKTLVIIEKPQIYDPRHQKGDPNDLITLAIQVGRYVEFFDEGPTGPTVELVLPRTWKGTCDADVLCRRVWSSLDPVEQEMVSQVLAPLARKPLCLDTLTEGRRHNVLDAIGLAKWSVKRTRAGVFS